MTTEQTPVGVPEHAATATPSAAEPTPPTCVMSIHAHPDDQEFTVGGTLAKWAKAGSRIITVCVTSGTGGSNKYTPLTMTRETLRPIREEEQRNACRVLGIEDVVYLGYQDGELVPTIELRKELTRLIRTYRPDAVITGDPTVRFYGNFYMNHPDHRATADVALDAVFPSAETRLIFTELLDEGLEPHQVQRVFIHGSEHPDTYIDISESLPTKLAALHEHRSQMGEWDPTEMITNWAKEIGAARGLEAAEAYRLMVLGGP